MEALILSCSTGGGHNTAAIALEEELVRRGHHVTRMDPFCLKKRRLADTVGNVYIKIVQKSPALFGLLYRLGNAYRRLPFRSPVYYANCALAPALAEYLNQHPTDCIFTTHLYPAEMLTCLKRRQNASSARFHSERFPHAHARRKRSSLLIGTLPPVIFIATDYTCIPFTEETDCDYYVIPPNREADFLQRGIPANKLLPYGIPVRQAFLMPGSSREAKLRLGLSVPTHYLLLSGGSMGAGSIRRLTSCLLFLLRQAPTLHLILVCGSNQLLYEQMKQRYGSHPQLTLLGYTEQMADYMRASTILLSKPGGLSSTEAAVLRKPLIHISPIPGCETINMNYFSSLGMSQKAASISRLPQALNQLHTKAQRRRMRQCQKKNVPANAASAICQFAELFHS